MSAEGGMRTRLKKGLLARKKRAEKLRKSDPSDLEEPSMDADQLRSNLKLLNDIMTIGSAGDQEDE